MVGDECVSSLKASVLFGFGADLIQVGLLFFLIQYSRFDQVSLLSRSLTIYSSIKVIKPPKITLIHFDIGSESIGEDHQT